MDALQTLLLIGLVSSWPTFSAEPQTYQVDDLKRWGRPSRVVAPIYPAEALAKGQTGFVDVEGRISPLLDLKEIEYQPDSGADTFVEALRQVVPFWEFYAWFGTDCFPKDDRVAVRVWFEIEDGKPKISITVRGIPPGGLPRITVLHREKPEYPRSMLRENKQAFVYVQSEVNPDGSVEKVTVQAFPQRGNGNAPFEREARRAMSRWRYSSLPNGQDKRLACHQIFWKIVN